MTKQDSVQTRLKLLVAASNIVVQEGVGSLTLDSVAQKAQVSKGGLLYHFPSKDALIEGMMALFVQQFEAKLAHELAQDSRPHSKGAWLRAFVCASFDTEYPEQGVVAAALAALVNSPATLAMMQTAYDGWKARAIASDIPPMTVSLIMLATDGLWYGELLGLKPLDEASRRVLRDHLIAMINDYDRGEEA